MLVRINLSLKPPEPKTSWNLLNLKPPDASLLMVTMHQTPPSESYSEGTQSTPVYTPKHFAIRLQSTIEQTCPFHSLQLCPLPFIDERCFDPTHNHLPYKTSDKALEVNNHNITIKASGNIWLDSLTSGLTWAVTLKGHPLYALHQTLMAVDMSPVNYHYSYLP